MTDTPDDLAARGRAIFERLRDLAEAPDHDAEASEGGDDAPGEETVGVDAPSGAAPSTPDEPPEPETHDAGDLEEANEPGAADESPVATDQRLTFPGAEDLADLRDGPGPVVANDATETIETAAEAAETVAPPARPSSPLDGVPAPEEASGFSRDLPRVMAIANQKGGVGKTTTAVNLSACLAELGYRVLVVDLDPQGNATTGLGVNPRNLQLSMYDVLLGDRPLDDCVEPTSVRGLFIAPSSLDLAGAEIELVPVFSREMKLRRALEAVRDDFDFVLIDCPPSLGLLTVNGLAAASEVVVPIQCEYYALEGLGQLLRNVTMVQQNLNPDLELAAIILVMFDARTRLSGEVVREVRSHFGAKVCRNVVPRTVRLSEAPSFGQPIIAFDPSSRGAIAYRELAKELSGGPARAGVA